MSVSFTAGRTESAYRIYLSGEYQTPVLGKLNRVNGLYTFSPVVPFSPGTNYVIRAGKDSLAGFDIPIDGSSGKSNPLLTILPKKDTIPENLLKCYLEFSEPMQEVGRALDFIKVEDITAGEEVKVFLDMEAELWNREHTRLTLWLDPGRIKTGLIPNKTLGTPLREGHTYLLSISGTWSSARGLPLGVNIQKKLYATRADREMIKPDLWEIDAPTAGTAMPLKIKFNEGLDKVMAREVMQIFNSAGQNVNGLWRPEAQDNTMEFVPERPWEAGQYALVVEPVLEDLAGNTVNRLFDSPLQNGADNTKALLEIRKDFVIDF